MAAGKEIRRLRDKVSAQQVATLIGVDAAKLRKWEQRDANPKDSGDITKVEKYFGTKIDQLHKLETFQFIPKPDPGATSSGPLSELTMFNFSESSRKLAESILIDAENRRNLIAENKILVQMVRAKPIEDAQLQNQQDVRAMRSAFLELLSEVGSGKRYKSPEEVKAAYNKALADALDLPEANDTQKNSGKKRKVK
jgi:transcriptional regulator with XRE-family HTH domain